MTQQAPFSFHCRICYERLNLTDRPPVVLPCGHTYICQVCSEKLTRCMECRTRIAPPPPKPVEVLKNHQYPHGHNVRKSYRQKQQEQRQNYYLAKEQQRQKFPVPTTVDELHTVLKAAVDAEPPKQCLPKNVVLMSLMEAADQKEALWNKSDEGYESGDDNEMVQAGLSALSASHGTYVVKAQEGLWVYDIKPTCLAVLPTASLSRSSSFSSQDPPGKSPAKGPAKEKKAKETEEPFPLARIPSNNSLSRIPSSNKSRRRSSRPKSPSTVMADPAVASISDTSCGSNSYHNNKPRFPSPIYNIVKPKPMERLLHGQTVQVVSFRESVVELARGGGYIRVENDDDLVKVGEPTDEACRIQGIIVSLGEEKKQYKMRINHLKSLEKRLQANLRKFYIREAEELEEKRQQAKLEQQLRAEKEQQLLNTSTCTVTSKASVAEELLAEADDTYRTVTPPSTPPPNLLELSPSGTSPGPTTPTRRRPQSRNSSCSAPTQYHYELSETRRDDSSILKTPAPVKDEEEKKDTDSPTTWDEDLFNQGCDLFFCATMPLCIGHNTTSAVDFATPALHPTSSILATGVNAGHYVQDHFGWTERSESFDGGSHLSSGSTVGSGGVDFATGMSGHTGMSRGRRQRRHVTPRKQVRMMSQHDGIAHIRRQQGKSGGASVYSCGGSSKASVVTL